MERKALFLRLLSIIAVLNLLSCLSSAAVSNSCAGLFVDPSISQKSPLKWAYYFPESLPHQNYGVSSEPTDTGGFRFKGDVAPGSPRVSYRKSTFFADGNRHPEFVLDQLSPQSETYQETQQILEHLYQLYHQRDTVPLSSIAEMRKIDQRLKIENLNYVVFSDSQSHEPKVIIRIFDGCPKTDHRVSANPLGEKIPLELEYPDLELPDRKAGNNNLLELGRLGKEDSVDGDLQALLRTVAEYLHQTQWSYWTQTLSPKTNASVRPEEPVIYVEALAPAARLYKNKYHFEVVFGPQDLKIPEGKPARYILRIRARDFIRQHQSQFETFTLR